MTSTYQILYWRDIPAQVKVRSSRQRASRSLSERFQEAIDEAAMRARATNTEQYLDDWRSTGWQEMEGDPENLADELISQLEATYPPERLEALKENRGYE